MNQEFWTILGFIVNLVVLIIAITKNRIHMEHRLSVLETYIKIIMKKNGVNPDDI